MKKTALLGGGAMLWLAAPALADLPDFQATPFECAGYDAATNSCASLSSPVFETPSSGVATSRAQFAFRPDFADLDAPPVLMTVTVAGPFTLREDDVFCSDYAASEIDVAPLDPATPGDAVARFTDLFTRGFGGAGYTCAYYTLENGDWVFRLEGVEGVPPEVIHLFSAEDAATLTLRPQPF